MDKVQFPYRSSSHLVLLHVIAESGSWAKHKLDVDYDKQIGSGDAHELVPKGIVEFVGGNHVSTYGRRARGDSWVYLGQTVNAVTHRLIVKPDSGINGLADLRGRKVGTRGSHPSLNDWLYLKQNNLDSDREDIELINFSKYKKGTMDPIDRGAETKSVPLWQQVKDGVVDACLLAPPASLFAKAAGLKEIDIAPLPMIQFTTVSSSLGFVEKHPDIVERFLKGMLEGIAFFKLEKEKAITIIQNRASKHGKMTREQAEATWADLARILEPKLMPRMQSIANVYEEAVRQDKDARRINPMELWDMHPLRRIDDSGFISGLYAGKPRWTVAHAHPHVAPDMSKLDPAHMVDHNDCDICAAGDGH